MLIFHSKDDFFNWLPIQKEVLLDYVGVSEHEFYGRYIDSENSTAELDKEDVSEIFDIYHDILVTK